MVLECDFTVPVSEQKIRNTRRQSTRRLEIVDSTRCFVAVALAVLSGCHADQSATTLSERYRVCANLPLSASFLPVAPGPDFDLGELKAGGLVVDVLIGGHPRFSRRVIKTGLAATDGFKLLGRERSDEQDKVLFAYERGDREGPMYVMFMAPDLGPVEQVLKMENLLVSCE